MVLNTLTVTLASRGQRSEKKGTELLSACGPARLLKVNDTTTAWYHRGRMQKVSQGGQGAASAARDPACCSGMMATKHYLANLHFL